MPGTIQRIPQGLQGFLELKGEQLPSPLSRELFAQVDLRRWYLETNAEIIVAPPQAMAAAGYQQFTEFVVPSTEWWHVSAIMANAQDFLAGEVLTNWALAVLIAPAGVPTLITGFRSLAGVAANPIIQLGATTDLFLPPGSSALVSAVEAMTGAGTIAPQVRITRLPF